MTELELFFAENVADADDINVIVSERFKDKNGNPVEWTLRPITAEKNNELKKAATKTVQVTGKPGQYRKEFDANKYMDMLTAATVVNPDLTNAKLQDSWSAKTGTKIMTPEQLLSAMLLSGEFDVLSTKVNDVNGYKDINEQVEEAKN